MTVAFSADVEVNILAWITGIQMPTPPTAVRFGLLSAEPDHDGANVHELNDFGYGRQTVTFGSITTVGVLSSMKNTNPLIFGPVTATDWAPAVYGAFFSADDDSLIAYGPLASSRTAVVGDTISFGVNSLQLRCK